MKIIYQIDTYYSNNLSALKQYQYNNMLHYGTRSVKKYANKINSDYELIRPKINNNSWIDAMLEKIKIFGRLLKSNYEYFIFFDLDIIIQDNAIDIFELINDTHILIDVVNDYESLGAKVRSNRQKEIIKKITGVQIKKYLSAGIYACGRPVAEKIYKNKNLFDKMMKNDEKFLSYVVHLEKIPIKDLSEFHQEFDICLKNSKKIDFIHYSGDSKEDMGFDFDFLNIRKNQKKYL